jgi:hypothetical protein
VGDTIAVHDLRATELQIGGVHFAAEELVDGVGTSQDDRLTLDLDGTLAETDEISTNTFA